MSNKETESKEVYRPFPWNYLPDKVAIGWAFIELAFVAPPFLFLIAIVTFTWWALQRIYFNTKALHFLPEMVRSVSRPLGKLMLKDARNHSYLPWIFFLAVYPPILVYLFYLRHQTHGFEILAVLLFHFLRLGPGFRFMAHLHVLVHKEGHDKYGLFKKPFQFLNGIVQWWSGPFYGQVPNSYGVAHNKIHHRWHNDLDDVHTNLDLDRTKPISFFIFVPRFTLYWMGVTPVLLFLKRKEYMLAFKTFYGMVYYYSILGFFLYNDFYFGLYYIVYPHFECFLFFAAIAYLWHAFVDPKDPTNQYVNSVTMLNGMDNIWNEDYHVVHHHSPLTHWTEIPDYYEKDKENYAKYNATIFENIDQGRLIHFLFAGDWDSMAKYFVDLNGKMTHKEKVDLIKTRLSFVVGKGGRKEASSWGTSETRDWEFDKQAK